MSVAADTPAERIATQIRTVAAAAKITYDIHPEQHEWLVQAITGYLVQNGTRSILDLHQYTNVAANLTFFYDVKTAHVYDREMGKRDTSGLVQGAATESAYSVEASRLLANLFANFVYEGNVKYWVYLVFTKDGYPVFLAKGEWITAGWNDFVKGAVFVAGSLVSAAFPALGASIGNAVMGAQFAAAYPGITAAIGNAAVSTALNGGDIQAGVTGAVGGLAGANVGSVVASAADSAIIGAAAAAATKAAIAGGDIEKAVAQALLVQGIKSADVGSLLSSKGPAMSDYFTDEYGITYGADADGELTVVDYIDENGIGYATDVDGDVMVVDTPTYADLTEPVYSPGGPTAPANPSSGGIAANVGGINLTDLAVTGLKLVAAWNQAGQPAVRASTAQSVANPNGTVTQRTATGQTLVTRMPAGTPYLTSDGSLVTNNGNGTYTTVRANGTTTTSTYPATGVASTGIGAALGINNQTLLIGGAAVLALLLLRRPAGAR